MATYLKINHNEQLQHFFSFALSKKINTGEAEREKVVASLHKNLVPCAVLVPFTHIKNELHILLTQRSTNLGNHAGQVSFPGGKIDQQDSSLIETALREANEEINISPNHVQIYGALPKIVIPSGFEISPVLAYLKKNNWYANQTEVETIFTIPATLALNPKNYLQENHLYQTHNLTIYSLDFLQYKIWGATANILYRLALSYENFKRVK